MGIAARQYEAYSCRKASGCHMGSSWHRIETPELQKTGGKKRGKSAEDGKNQIFWWPILLPSFLVVSYAVDGQGFAMSNAVTNEILTLEDPSKSA